VVDAIRVWRSFGFQLVREARHGPIYRRPGDDSVMLIFPRHPDLSPGVLRQQLRDAGVTWEEFEERL